MEYRKFAGRQSVTAVCGYDEVVRVLDFCPWPRRNYPDTGYPDRLGPSGKRFCSLIIVLLFTALIFPSLVKSINALSACK